MRARVRACVRKRTYARASAFMCRGVRACMPAFTRAQVRACASVPACVRARVRACVHAITHAYIHSASG
eukprot:1783920-Alexandrium_andersonii.AAC.1